MIKITTFPGMAPKVLNLAPLEAEAGDAVSAHAGNNDVERRCAEADENGVYQHPPKPCDGQGVDVVAYLPHGGERERIRQKFIVGLE